MTRGRWQRAGKPVPEQNQNSIDPAMASEVLSYPTSVAMPTFIQPLQPWVLLVTRSFRVTEYAAYDSELRRREKMTSCTRRQ